MATILRPIYPYTDGRTTVSCPIRGGPSLGFGVNAARRLERTRHACARTIDVSLLWLCLVAGITQAVSLLFVVAGQIFG